MKELNQREIEQGEFYYRRPLNESRVRMGLPLLSMTELTRRNEQTARESARLAAVRQKLEWLRRTR